MSLRGAILQIKRKKVPFFIKKNDYKGMKIEINCTGSDTIQLHELTEFQGELKERSAGDIEKIIKSIKKHGFSFPFFVWKNDGKNNVIDGHGRLKALQQMAAAGEEIPALPCVYISAKDEAEAKEKLLKLNSQYGHMTAESVAEFLDGLEINFDEIALPDGLLDLSTLNEEKTETEGDDDAGEVQDGEPDSKLGEMYELGNSILMCGDSTDAESVARLMGGEKADLVFTDPPYGMGLNTDFSSMKNHLDFAKDKNVKNGKRYDAGFVDEFKPELITTVFKNFGYCKEIFLWGADYFAELLENKNEGSWVVWDKRSNEWDKDEGEKGADKMYGSCFELCWSKQKHKRDIARVKWASVFGTEQEFDHKRYHPTQKPIKLIKWFLSRYAKENEIVVDLFGGSGSTLIGCEELDIRARVMELDPHYCDVIRRRYTKWAKQNGRPIISGCLE